ncbi:DCC1 [Auxenochlorella protothecoides x Auxenochlorella symbiontica]
MNETLVLQLCTGVEEGLQKLLQRRARQQYPEGVFQQSAGAVAGTAEPSNTQTPEKESEACQDGSPAPGMHGTATEEDGRAPALQAAATAGAAPAAVPAPHASGRDLLVHAASEKLLRKGFRRSTHVGPPWLASAADALALSVSKKHGPTLTAKARGRLVGVVGEPDVIDDTVFELNSYSSDDDWIIDKEYLKLRAAKLTGSRGRKGAARGDLKDSGTTPGIPGLMLPC